MCANVTKSSHAMWQTVHGRMRAKGQGVWYKKSTYEYNVYSDTGAPAPLGHL